MIPEYVNRVEITVQPDGSASAEIETDGGAFEANDFETFAAAFAWTVQRCAEIEPAPPLPRAGEGQVEGTAARETRGGDTT